MIDYKAFFDGLRVIIGTTTLLPTQDEAFHQFILWHVELNHRCHFVTTLVEHLLQGLCLWDGTGESVEDDTFMLTSERIIHRGKNADHQIVGNQLSVVDIALGGLTEFRTVFDFRTKHITR